MLLLRTRLLSTLILHLVALQIPICPTFAAGGLDLESQHLHYAHRLLSAELTDPLQELLTYYPDNSDLSANLEEFTKRCGHISRVVTIGNSLDGIPIQALEISDKPGQIEAEPNVKIVGNLHGDEPTGRVLTIALAEWLCAHYNKDSTAKRIVKDVHLWLVPTLNPDGFAAHTRHNKNGKDLNRNFPDHFHNPSMQPTGREEPETKAMMEWSLETRFTSSLAIHEGALVANYPWDGTPNKTTEYNACPDDATFKFLASTYADNHRKMALPENREFPNGGTTNGAAWYPIYGSMQDWNYVSGSCMEVTLEVSERKWPDESGLPELFEDNREAMLKYILASSLGGLRGKVMAESSALRKSKGKEMLPVEAAITIEGSDFTVHTGGKHGDFYRPLAPGKYVVVVTSEGFPPARANITVPTSGHGVVRDFVLRQKKPAAVESKWKEMKKNVLPHLVLTPAEQQHDNLVLLAGGVLVLYGLWFTHRRMVYRSFVSNRQRSM